MTRSSKPLSLLVVGDVDMLRDRNWIQRRQILGQAIAQSFANNGDFIVNAVEQMAGGAVLAGLRGRGVSWRPFERIVEIEQQAQARYLNKERELMQRLQQTEKRLASINRKGGEHGELLSRMPRVKSRSSGPRCWRRVPNCARCSSACDCDVERLKNWLTALNVGVFPVLVAAIALVFALRRPKHDVPGPGSKPGTTTPDRSGGNA
ncbi:MAG: hypothetical protein R3E48_18455 [Burkholderiaceae bacterium]